MAKQALSSNACPLCSMPVIAYKIRKVKISEAGKVQPQYGAIMVLCPHCIKPVPVTLDPAMFGKSK